MGKSLVIKGADFASSAMNQVFSTSQTSLDLNKYYDGEGVLKTRTGITGTVQMDIPENADVLICSASSTGLQPMSIQCFDASGNFLGNAGSQDTGGAVAIGTYLYYLPVGTKKYSYVYDNTWGTNNIHLGIALTWSYV